MKETKLYLITDPHFFATELGCSGEAYEDFMHYEQKCFAETESICTSVFEYLKNAREADTVLIAGDLSFNGERKSHEKFLRLLYELKESGKTVRVVTADHDYKEREGQTFAFNEKGRYSPDFVKREELFDMYADFGFGEAIAEDREHLSYVVQLNEGVRLLCLNCDLKLEGRYHFNEKQLDWIREQTKKAREDSQTMLAMCHYPILPGQPLFQIISSVMIKDAYSFATFLADEGVKIIFTGHMHNQSINYIDTEKGNRLYDVTTGSIIADPAIIRHISLTDGRAEIRSIPTPDFEWDTDDCKKYLRDMFDRMIVNVLTDMRDDTPRVMKKLHIEEKASTQKLLKTVGKFVCSLKLGTLSKMLFIKCDPSIKNRRVLDYATRLVREVFEGNQSYVEGTPEGDVFLALIKRLSPVLKRLDIKGWNGEKADLYDILKNSAGNYGIDDYNAVLEW